MNNRYFMISSKDQKIDSYKMALLLEAICPYKEIYRIGYFLDNDIHEGGMIKIDDENDYSRMMKFFEIKKNVYDCYILDEQCHHLNDDRYLSINYDDNIYIDEGMNIIETKKKGHTMLVALGFIRNAHKELNDIFAGKIEIDIK